MTRNYGRSRRQRQISTTSAAQPAEKIKRGRTRSTLRNFFGRLTRSSSQEIRNTPSHYESRTVGQNKNNILK